MLLVPWSHSLVPTPVCAFLMALLKGPAILLLSLITGRGSPLSPSQGQIGGV